MYLSTALARLPNGLPEHLLQGLLFTMFNHLANAFLRLITQSLRRVNIYALQSLQTDFLHLEKFAASCGVRNLQETLAPVIQVSLLLSSLYRSFSFPLSLLPSFYHSLFFLRCLPFHDA